MTPSGDEKTKVHIKLEYVNIEDILRETVDYINVPFDWLM